MHLKFCAVFLLIFCYCGVNADIFNKGEGTSLILGIITCPFGNEPFACLRSQMARALDIGDRALEVQTQQIKVDADIELEERIQSRAISSQEIPKQKPSDIIETYQNALASISDYISDQFNDDVNKKKKKIKSNKPMKSKKKLLRNKSNLLKTDCLNDDCDNGLPISSADNTDDTENNQNDWNQYDNNENERHIKKKHIKKKHKKALLKIFIIIGLIKAKINFLLKLVSIHLKLKTFGVIMLSVLLHIVRFIIGLKPKHETQEVIYYEHANHHHHYESRDKDFGGSGGYLKLALDASSLSKHKHRQDRQYQPLEQWNTKVNLNIPMPRLLTADERN